jgi:hypothetical protein
MNDPCPKRHVLAEGPICRVERCDCGILHLTLGVLTLRLHPDVVGSIAETLTVALARLPAKAEPASDHPPRARWLGRAS